MKLLNESAQVIEFSQWGEEGIIQTIFDRIGVGNKMCIEFGAADGLFCSNTAHLWKNQGWTAFLYESDPDLCVELEKNIADYPNVTGACKMVEKLDDLVDFPVDLVSMDIDGLEYSVLYEMDVKHRVLIVEHNPTFPPHMLVRGGAGIGTSARSIVELAERKGYKFLTATLTNLFFVLKEESGPFVAAGYDFDLEHNFDRSSLNYVITDYTGGYDLKGAFPYGLSEHREMEASTIVPPHIIPYLVRQHGFSEWALSRFPTLSVEEYPEEEDDEIDGE